MRLYTQNKRLVDIEEIPFAKGGQGGIHIINYPIISPLCVAKLYLSLKKAKEVEKRILYMINNNPFANAQQMIADSFAWPLDALFNDKNEFVGFTMRLISDSKPLWNMTISKGFKEKKWKKFNISKSDSYNKRLKVLYNACQALNVLDKSGVYRVVDLKPQNMMLTNNAHIKIIDCDSFQIAQNNNILFNAEAATDEYCPPEFHQGQVNFRNQFVCSNWDYFAFAVTAYQILFCIHPFNGSHPIFQTQGELIKNGLFVHGNRKNEFVKIPSPHINFDSLISVPIRDLFRKALDYGYNNPNSRPDFEQWRDVILAEIKKLNNVPTTAGKLQPTLKQNKTKNNPRPKKINYRTSIPVFNAVVHQFKLQYGRYTAKVSWDISMASTVYLNGKKVALKGTQVVPLLDKVYSLLILDNNGFSKNIQKKVKAPLEITMMPITQIKIPTRPNYKLVSLNPFGYPKNANLIGVAGKSAKLYTITQNLLKPVQIKQVIKRTVNNQNIENPVKLNDPIKKKRTPVRKQNVFKTLYKAAAFVLIIINQILTLK